MATDKVDGVVQKMGEMGYDSAPTFCHAVDDWGVWHFIHRKNVSKVGRLGWEDVRPGSRVRFVSVEQGRGKYIGLEVEVVES